jgi:hypothetical protein
MSNLESGDRIWINMPKSGYVGVGIVTEKSAPVREAVFIINEQETPFFDLPLNANYGGKEAHDKEEHLVKVEWLKTVSKSKAVSEYGFFGNQNTVCRPKADKWEFTIKRLKELWKINGHDFS